MSLPRRVRRPSVFVVTLLLVVSLLAPYTHPTAAAPPAPHVQESPPIPITQPVAESLPLAFVPNRGQNNSIVQYMADGSDMTVSITSDGFTLGILNLEARKSSPQHARARPRVSGSPSTLRLQHISVRPNAPLFPLDQLPGVFNDYTAADSAQWQSGLAMYASLSVPDLYSAIEVRYDSDNGALRRTYTVAPGGDPSRIRWRYSGVQSVELAPSGDLVLTLPPIGGQASRVLTETAPIAWQNVGTGRIDVGVRFTRPSNGVVGFTLDTYDPTLPLVIDPTIESGYTLSGSRFADVAAHPDGTWYVVGCTGSFGGGRLWHLSGDATTLIATTRFGPNAGCGDSIATTSTGLILASAIDDPIGTAGEDVITAAWLPAASTPIIQRIATGTGIVRDIPVAVQPGSSTGYVMWTTQTLPSNVYQPYLAAVTNGSIAWSEAFNGRDIAVNRAGNVYTVDYTNLKKRTAQGWSIIGAAPYSDKLTIDPYADTIAVIGQQVVYGNPNEPTISTGQILTLRVYTSSGGVRFQYTFPGVQKWLFLDAANFLTDGSVLLAGTTDSPNTPLVGATTPLNPTQQGIYWARIAANGSGMLASDVLYPAGNLGTNYVKIAVNAADEPLLSVFSQNTNDSARSSFVASLKGISPPSAVPPDYTVSYYEYTKDSEVFRNQGCRARENGEQGIVFLFFGGPTATGTSGFNSNPTFADIRRTVKAFTDGYFYHTGCYKTPGSPQGVSVNAPKAANLTIAVSTSNSDLCPTERDVDGNCPGGANPNPNVNSASGELWARMVAGLYYDTAASGIKGITIAGGLDAEPDWDNAHLGKTTQWIEGYANIPEAEVKTLPPLYIFGSTDGSPRVGYPIRPWTDTEQAKLTRVYDWNFKRPITRSVPQIYNASFAQEWYQVLAFTEKYRAAKSFNGTMTNCGSSSNCPPFPYTNSRWETYETCPQAYKALEPTAGWYALSDRLNRTLKNPLTLTSNFILPGSYRVSEGLSVTIPGEGTLSNCERISPRTLPSGTVFEAGNVFRYRITPAPSFTLETARPVQWATDITNVDRAPVR